MPFDLARVLRRLKPQCRARPLARRPDEHLPFVAEAGRAGPPLLLDSTVYIDILQGRSPAALDELIALRTCQHSAVCLAELTHAFGRLDPHHPATAAALAALTAVIEAIPVHRLAAPNGATWGEAGVLGGLLFRLGRHVRGQERACLNDALIYLQARKLSCIVVTANVADFDRLNQLVVDGQVLFYRAM